MSDSSAHTIPRTTWERGIIGNIRKSESPGKKPPNAVTLHQKSNPFGRNRPNFSDPYDEEAKSISAAPRAQDRETIRGRLPSQAVALETLASPSCLRARLPEE